MARIDKIPIISNPYLIDKVVAEIQKGLIAHLGWLDYAFGKAQRLTKIVNNKRVITPNVYAGGNYYIEVTPDINIGNFSFVTVDDPQMVNWQANIPGYLDVVYSLIFWFDFRKISGADNRNMEFIKSEILKVLNSNIKLKGGRINVEKIYELNENIYRGYTLDEVDNQYLTHPFGGLRFTGEMKINESCYN